MPVVAWGVVRERDDVEVDFPIVCLQTLGRLLASVFTILNRYLVRLQYQTKHVQPTPTPSLVFMSHAPSVSSQYRRRRRRRRRP